MSETAASVARRDAHRAVLEGETARLLAAGESRLDAAESRRYRRLNERGSRRALEDVGPEAEERRALYRERKLLVLVDRYRTQALPAHLRPAARRELREAQRLGQLHAREIARARAGA